MFTIFIIIVAVNILSIIPTVAMWFQKDEFLDGYSNQ